jgi:hypothetical protein
VESDSDKPKSDVRQMRDHRGQYFEGTACPEGSAKVTLVTLESGKWVLIAWHGPGVEGFRRTEWLQKANHGRQKTEMEDGQ